MAMLKKDENFKIIILAVFLMVGLASAFFLTTELLSAECTDCCDDCCSDCSDCIHCISSVQVMILVDEFKDSLHGPLTWHINGDAAPQKHLIDASIDHPPKIFC